MNEPSGPDGSAAISADDAERLLAGAELDSERSPVHSTLDAMFTAARSVADRADPAEAALIVAAFNAERLAVRDVSTHLDNRLKAITRRTAAILGIATGASLGVALAAGAVGNPFTPPGPVDHAPATTSLPVSVDGATSATVGSPGSLDVVANTLPAVSTSIGNDPTESAETPTELPTTDTLVAPNGVDRPAGASGQTPAATAPGQTEQTPAATAPGQTEQTPAATAPGQTEQTPAATAPGQTEQTPAATAPGQTEQTPAATAPGQTNERPVTDPPGREGA